VLADERTDLAWNRSGLALIACGLVVMRGFTLAGLPPAQVAVGAVILVLGALTYALAGWHAQRRLRGEGTARPAKTADLLPVAIGIAIVGLAAFVLGALFPS
jgi:putative membrane protein